MPDNQIAPAAERQHGNAAERPHGNAAERQIVPAPPRAERHIFARSWFDRLGVSRVWSSIAESGRRFAVLPAATLRPVERAKLLTSALISGRGEASGAAIARELHAVLSTLDAPQRLAVYTHLATSFAPDPAKLSAAASAYLAAPSAEAAAALADAAEPPRQEVLRRMNMSPGGTGMLVAMRKEILAVLKDNPALKALDSDLRHLLASWFNRGFLELRRIDLNTPAAVLDKLIAYEAVHEIQGWEDLRRRLAADRRCFGFFHPALPGEPLIFVEVALVNGLAGSVTALLARDTGQALQGAHESAADTAIFYSISNCQDGLRGISFGNFLIKQVVEELRAELPQLTRFSTLSPIPGLRAWLDKNLDDKDVVGADITDADRAILKAPGWWLGIAATEVQAPLMRLCARYLTTVRKGRGPIDPVAKFHLGNGARLERINWMGNPSERGIGESFGLMVNYLYDIGTIEANHEAFAREDAVICGAEVKALLAPEAVKPRRFPRLSA
jgi:malonyl-CoA decarboxylase